VASNNQFKVVLLNMKQEDLLNFIWVYDQYVQNLNTDEYPVTIESFYKNFYKTQLIK